MSDDAVNVTIRAWFTVAPRTGVLAIVRHTSRSWFRLSRADRNRLRRGDIVRDSAPFPRYRRTRAMRAAARRSID